MSLQESNGRQSWLYKLMTGPALVTILVALMGQAMVSVVYQIVNNEQQNAAIITNAQDIKALRAVVFDMQTPLAFRVFKTEDSLTNMISQQIAVHADLNRRLDQMDTIGTRALIVVSNNQQRVMSQVDRLAERMMMTDKRVGDIDIGPAVLKLQAQIDALELRVKKLEERQR